MNSEISNKPIVTSRYKTLDAWRFLAAIPVILDHMGAIPRQTGYWSIVIFFVISGYCVTAAVDSSRAANLNMFEYAKRRVRRIYPPYFFAIIYFALTRLAKAVVTGQNELRSISTSKWIENLTMTPWIHLLKDPVPMAGDNPHQLVAAFWSLNYEEQFYLVLPLLVLLALWFRIRFRVVMYSSMVLAALWILGPGKWCRGIFLDFWIVFSLGHVVFAVVSSSTPKALKNKTIFYLWLLFLIMILCVVKMPRHDALRYREIMVASGFSLALIYLHPFDERLRKIRTVRVFMSLGAITYSLYLIHQCNLFFVHAVAYRLFGRIIPSIGVTAIEVMMHLGIAAMFWRFFEKPFLNKPLFQAKAANTPLL